VFSERGIVLCLFNLKLLDTWFTYLYGQFSLLCYLCSLLFCVVTFLCIVVYYSCIVFVHCSCILLLVLAFCYSN
jgi:hypothetical protein